MTRKTICLMAAVMAIMLCLCSCSTTKQNLEDIVTISSGHFACTYDGVKHDFIVDTPENPVGSSLVIMLPGAGGTAESFRQSTLFHEKACPNGYTVVYVTGAPDPKDSSSATSWNHNGRKDGNDDVGFLKTLALFIQDKYHTDPNRCFAAGFSNGAFMCHRLAMEASDTFSAVISVAGTISNNTWNSRPKDCKASLLQIAGEKDDVIPKHSDNSARYSAFPAIEEVIDYYANGLGLTEVRKIGKESTLTEYSNPSRQVWFLYVKDGRHSWSAESVTGIDTNALIIDFLSQMK